MIGAAIECGKAITHLTRHPVHILKGGYERFSGIYHFFRTQKIIWMPQVRWGAEHRQGAWKHGLPLRTTRWGAEEEKEEKETDNTERMERFQRLGLG